MDGKEEQTHDSHSDIEYPEETHDSKVDQIEMNSIPKESTASESEVEHDPTPSTTTDQKDSPATLRIQLGVLSLLTLQNSVAIPLIKLNSRYRSTDGKLALSTTIVVMVRPVIDYAFLEIYANSSQFSVF